MAAWCAGDYGSAIETLVTAVSLINRSKLANDEHCLRLVATLQATLHDIERRSYAAKLVTSCNLYLHCFCA